MSDLELQRAMREQVRTKGLEATLEAICTEFNLKLSTVSHNFVVYRVPEPPELPEGATPNAFKAMADAAVAAAKARLDALETERVAALKAKQAAVLDSVIAKTLNLAEMAARSGNYGCQVNVADVVLGTGLEFDGHNAMAACVKEVMGKAIAALNERGFKCSEWNWAHMEVSWR